MVITLGDELTNLVAKGPAERFGRNRVLGILGEGSLGQLHAAEQGADDGFVEIVALRTFHAQLIAAGGSVTAVADSARIAATLKHPNIASSDELEESDGLHFQATEYLAGESLASLLASCGSQMPIPPAMVATLMSGCVEGLRHAYESPISTGQAQKLAHGDIRPSNVFITFQGSAKVLGFGAGGALSQIPSVRASSRGGFAYTAPESLESCVADTRADVFSIGVIFWECLTGRQLFAADTITKTKDAVRSRYVEPPSVLRPEVPSVLDEIVLRALSRDPRRRYQSVTELSQALKRFLMALPRRPTPETIADWMRNVFGAERVALKYQISQGTAVEGALARLRLLGEAAPGVSNLPGASDGGDRRVHPDIEDARTVVRIAPVSSSIAPGAPPPSAPAATLPPPFRDSSASAILVPSPRTPVGTATAGRPSTPAPVPVTRSGTSNLALPAPAVPPPGRRLPPVVMVGAGVAAAAIVVALLSFRSGGGDSSPAEEAATPVGALQIQSTPPGAQVLIDGDPSGLVTPAQVNGLRAGRKIDVQVEKPGYRSTKQSVEVPVGGPKVLSFVLEESSGNLRIEGLPTHATTYVDDAPVNASQPLILSLGPHRLRVEVGGQLYSSSKLEVRKGSQVVRLQDIGGSSQ